MRSRQDHSYGCSFSCTLDHKTGILNFSKHCQECLENKEENIYSRIIFFYTELSYRVDKTCTFDYARTITESVWKDYLRDCVGYENYIVANNIIFTSNIIPQIISFTEHIDKSWQEIRGSIKRNPKVHYITEYILCTATSIC